MTLSDVTLLSQEGIRAWALCFHAHLLMVVTVESFVVSDHLAPWHCKLTMENGGKVIELFQRPVNESCSLKQHRQPPYHTAICHEPQGSL